MAASGQPELGERWSEFQQLGPHEKSREKMLVWKVPPGSGMAVGQILAVPFLQFADETIEDTDEILLPILDEIMRAAALEQGIAPPKIGRA